MWVLDHEDDLDADFLAIYGIDLEQVDMPAARYFALAHRLTAYQGVMAARVDEEREQSPSSSSTTRTRDSAPPAPGGGRDREVPLAAFRVLFPGVVSGGKGGG